MPGTENDRQRIGTAVQTERASRSWSVETATKHGGIGHMTWRRIERGDHVQAKSYHGVDRAFGWPSGTTMNIIAGETQPRRPTAPPKAADFASIVQALVNGIVNGDFSQGQVNALREIIDSGGNEPDSPHEEETGRERSIEPELAVASSGSISGREPTLKVDGPALRRFRQRAQLGIKELAERVDVTPSYISRLELGSSSRVSVRVYRELRAALGLTRDEGPCILTDESNPEPVESPQKTSHRERRLNLDEQDAEAKSTSTPPGKRNQ